VLEDLLALRKRLDRLTAVGALRPGLADRAARAAGRVRPPPEPRELVALDRGLDRAGVHTLADARVLSQLVRGRAKGLAELRGLTPRAKRALREFSAQLGHEERQARLRSFASQAALARLEDLWARLARAVKVADFFARPDAPRDDLCELLPAPIAADAPPTSARVASAEYLVRRARASALDEHQKKRALEEAHELLLRIGSEVDRDRVRRLRAEVAEERARFAAHALLLARPPADPVARLSQASRRGDGGAAWGEARELYKDAVASRDAQLGSRSRQVLSALEPHIEGGLAKAVQRDRARVFMDSAGEEGAIAAQLRAESPERTDRDRLTELALDLEGDRWAVFDLALGAGRFFNVEEDSAEELAEESPYAAPARLTRVPYPGPVQTMDVAQSIGELRNFVITDPRSILYDLASHRQLMHAWLEPEGGGSLTRKHGTGAVRVYVCDASGSMKGARSVFRDALLIAELNNLSVREARAQPCVPIYFSFFTDHPTTLERVDNADAAMRVIGELFRESPAEGRTDITFALESAFAAIRHARGTDADLARATVVLVTDGEDRVDMARLWAAKAPVGEIEITLNCVALGIENRDLKELVQQQRGTGRRAFYYHLSDEEVAGGRALFDCGLRTLLPARPVLDLKADEPEVKAAIEGLASLAEERRRAPRDDRAPALRFDSYFTQLPKVEGRAAEQRDLELAGDLLEAVAETIALAPAEERACEAVRLVEHLLQVYSVDGAAFALALTSLPPKGIQALEKIRLLGAPASVP